MTANPRRTALALALALGACGTTPTGPPQTSSGAEPDEPPVAVEGPLVATVDGEPITLAEVEEASRRTGLSPLAALHRLEQERVLYRRARRAALGADAEATRALRRASVQALLRTRVEEVVTPSSIDDAEIAARYAASRASWVRPERRASVNVLARLPEGADAAARAAADRFVRAALSRLASGPDPAAEADAIRAEGAPGQPFTLVVETLPATARHGSLEEPYLAALFAIPSAPGVALEPVTTSYGVHAIALTSLEPSFEVALAEATPILRRQLLAEHRGAALDALTAELASRTAVAVDERLAATVLAADLQAVGAP